MMLNRRDKRVNSKPVLNSKPHGKPKTLRTLLLPNLLKEKLLLPKMLIPISTTLSISQHGLESSRQKKSPQPQPMVVLKLHLLPLPLLKMERKLAQEKKSSKDALEMKVRSACRANSPLLLTNAELPSLLVSVDSVLSRWLS
jgi:hypothetical protein